MNLKQESVREALNIAELYPMRTACTPEVMESIREAIERVSSELCESYMEAMKEEACGQYLRCASEYGEKYAENTKHFSIGHIVFIVERNAHGELVARQDEA